MTRQNSKGDPCPPWCTADHSQEFADACVGRPHGAAPAWACPVRRGGGSLFVHIAAVRDGPGASLDLSPRDAGQLAGVLAMTGAGELAAAIRRAAEVITQQEPG